MPILGAYTFNFRNYDPKLNRWTSVDPIGFPDGANNHSYLKDPISFYDILGLSGKHIVVLDAVIWPKPDKMTQYNIDLCTGMNEACATTGNGWRNDNIRWMERMDTTSDPKTHYIDDEDTLIYNSIWNLSEVAAWSSAGFTSVYLIVHGGSSGDASRPWRIADNLYSDTEINQSGVIKWDGCTADLLKPTISILTGWPDEIRNTLKE